MLGRKRRKKEAYEMVNEKSETLIQDLRRENDRLITEVNVLKFGLGVAGEIVDTYNLGEELEDRISSAQDQHDGLAEKALRDFLDWVLHGSLRGVKTEVDVLYRIGRPKIIALLDVATSWRYNRDMDMALSAAIDACIIKEGDER